jgi:hypothetical protein
LHLSKIVIIRIIARRIAICMAADVRTGCRAAHSYSTGIRSRRAYNHDLPAKIYRSDTLSMDSRRASAL